MFFRASITRCIGQWSVGPRSMINHQWSMTNEHIGRSAVYRESVYIEKYGKSWIFWIFEVFGIFLIFLWPFWGPGGIPLDSQRNFDPPWGLNTPGAFFWTHFSQLLIFFRIFDLCNFQFFWKSRSQTPLSGQSPLSKMIVYWSSSYEVFIQIVQFHCVLPITLPLFMKKPFFIWTLYLQL